MANKNMNCVIWNISFLLLVQIVWVSGSGPGFYEKIEECKNQTKANEDEVLNIFAHRVPKTVNEKSMLACLQKKIEFMGTDNKINLDQILNSIKYIQTYNIKRYEKLKTLYEDCAAAELTEADECLVAFSFAQCVYPKLPKPFIGNIPHNIINGIIMQECRNKSGANDDEQMHVLQHKLPITKNEQCMMACILKKKGHLTSDNKINVTNLTASLEHMKRHSSLKYNDTVIIYTQCKAAEKIEKDECVAAKNFAECIYPKERMNRLGSRMKIIVTECGNETKSSAIEVDNTLTHIAPKQKNEKCMFACIQKKMGNMKEDNTMDVDKMKKKMSYLQRRNPDLLEQLGKLLDDCKAKEKKEADECEAGGKFAECVYSKENEIRKAYMNRSRRH